MPKSNIAHARAIARFLIGIGAMTALVGLVLLINAIRFIHQSDLIVARVIENPGHRTSGSQSATVYRPVFSFTDANGREVTAQVRMASTSFDYQVDSEVEIYLRHGSSPPRIRIADFAGLWFLPAIFLFIGLTFMGICSLLLRSTHKRAQSRDDGFSAYLKGE